MEYNILIIPPSMGYPGSTGDEALILGIKDYLSSKGNLYLGIVVKDGSNPEWKPFRKEGIKLYNLNNIDKNLGEYNELYVLGADVIDGGSQLHNAIEFFHLIGKFNMPTRLIGFSFNNRPIKRIIEKFRALPEDTKIYVRDPSSFKRFVAETEVNAKQVADVAFLLKPKKPKPHILRWIKEQKLKSRIVLGVNINSNKLTKKIFQAYVDALGKLQNVSILIIPHDSRAFCGDLKAIQLLWKNLSNKLKKHSLKLGITRAREAKYICGELDCVLTGRMHLTIASLDQGTPVLCIGYQNKMEGLLHFFGLERYVVQRKTVANIINLLPDLIKNRRKIKVKIRRSLPKVKELARKNFG